MPEVAVKRVEILNGSFDAVTLQETVARAIDLVESGERGYLCTVNVAILMMIRGDPRLQEFTDRARIVVADGQPLIWASRLLRDRLPERVAGVELVEVLSARAAEKDIGIYLLGAKREVVEKLAERLTATIPKLRICGIADGYFGADEAPKRVRAIAESGAKILFVGMGVPRQEYFLQDHWDALGVNFAMGVGGSFDVIAGLRKRAPRFVQKIGMEWMFRLVQEPRRLWKRYLVTNTQFVYRLCGALLRGKRAQSPRSGAGERA